ncbi:AsmA family protein [Parvularcula oceani]|uniref:AsmA family protein n=1 Tax=Parvularcula oceani TaxID=1247963 RepID=UPI0004E10624|nr:AsmA-like C-terminal region-containing protein [Parvularcula oceani]
MRKWIVIGVAAVLVLIAAGLFALTRPSVGTPVAEYFLRMAFGEDASVEEAWMRYTPRPVVEGRGLSAPPVAELETVSGRFNWLGLFPGTPLFALVDGRNGAVRIDLTGQADSQDGEDGGGGVGEWIEAVAAETVRLDVVRRAGTAEVLLQRGRGSLTGGSIAFAGEAGGGTIIFDGTGAILDPQTIRGDVVIRARNPNALAQALSIALPNLPPLQIAGDLEIGRNEWVLRNLEGKIGDSAATGLFIVNLQEEVPQITADLDFAPLDFDDVGVVFGLPSRNEGAAPLSPAQRRANRAYGGNDMLLPRARVDFDRLQKVDARIDIEASPVEDAPYPVDRMSLQATLEDGVLRIGVFHVDGPQGELTVEGTVDASGHPARSELVGDLRAAQLEELVPKLAAKGPLSGEFDLELTGDDFQQAFAGANGEFSLWSTEAQVAALYIEGAGLDLGEALMLLFDGEETTYTRADCFVTRLDIREGTAIISPGVLETEDSLLLLNGSIDLATEELSIDVDTEAKDASLGELFGSVKISGTLRAPEIEIPEGEVIGQAALTAGLAAIAGPLGLLPFVEGGEGENAPCGRLIGRANGVLKDQ